MTKKRASREAGAGGGDILLKEANCNKFSWMGIKRGPQREEVIPSLRLHGREERTGRLEAIRPKEGIDRETNIGNRGGGQGKFTQSLHQSCQV